METLKDYVTHYYTNDYNCAETLLRAANDYYQLGMTDDDMKTMGGFGAGMYSGMVCGALVGSVAAISKKVVKQRAHATPNMNRIVQSCVQDFKNRLGAVDCKDVRPMHHTTEEKCLPTCLLAAETLEQVMASIE